LYDNVAQFMGEGSAASNALVQSTLLGELIEHAKVGVLASDSGRYIAANNYACELTGYDRSELIGRRVAELKCERAAGEFAFRRKDGGEIEVAYRAVDSNLSGIGVTVGLFWPA
jgi:PAS domain-containing protein